MTQERLKNNGLVIISNEVYPVFNKTMFQVIFSLPNAFM